MLNRDDISGLIGALVGGTLVVLLIRVWFGI